MDVRHFTIRDESDAWRVIQRAIDDSSEWGGVEIEFDGWPVIQFRVQGRKFGSTITTKNMEGFLDLQRTINRAYAQLVYNASSAKSLKASDRDALELVVKVEDGSSKFLAKLEDSMGSMFKDMAGKMDGKQATITICVVAVLVAGSLGWKDYLDTKIQEKEIEGRHYMSSEETERLRVIKEIIKERPGLGDVSADIERHHGEMLKSLSEAESIESRGVSLSQEEAKHLVDSVREASEEKRIDGVFRVIGVDASSDGVGYRIHVRRVDDSAEFHADVRVISYDEEQILRSAVFDKEPIYLAFSARVLRGSVSSAKLITAKRVDSV